MDTETEKEEETEMMEEEEEQEPMVFEVSEIDSDYEFDAARWFDFTKEESPLESRANELWFETTAQPHPNSPFAIKLMSGEFEFSLLSEHGEEFTPIVRESVEDDVQVSLQSQYANEPVNETSHRVFNFTHGGSNLNKVPNQSLHKGPTVSNHIRSEKVKCQPKSSIRPIPRSSTLMKPTASQLAKLDSARAHMQEKGLFASFASETQAAKRQKLDGGLLRKVAETTNEIDFVHKALKKERSSHNVRIKITVPKEPDFATSRRANRHKEDAKLDQDSRAVYRFKARPLNRKILEAPSLPIHKKSTPKLPEFQEFRLKTSERAMQHSSAVSTGNNHHKGSHKPDTTAFVDGINREPRRPRGTDISKDDDRKHIFRARPHNNKVLSSGQDIGIISKSKRETTAPPMAQTQESSFHSEKKTQLDLPTELFSKLSIKSELQPDNGARLRLPQPDLVKASKENRQNSFQAGTERTSKVIGKPMVQQCEIVPETSRKWNARR